MEGDEEKTGENGGSIRATSTESKTGTVCLQSSHPREQPKTDGCLSLVKQAISRGDYGVAATAYPPHAIVVPPPLPEQYQDEGGSALDIEE